MWAKSLLSCQSFGVRISSCSFSFPPLLSKFPLHLFDNILTQFVWFFNKKRHFSTIFSTIRVILKYLYFRGGKGHKDKEKAHSLAPPQKKHWKLLNIWTYLIVYNTFFVPPHSLALSPYIKEKRGFFSNPQKCECMNFMLARLWWHSKPDNNRACFVPYTDFRHRATLHLFSS